MLWVGWGVGMGSGDGGLFLRFILVYIPILGSLLSLESLEKFVKHPFLRSLYFPIKKKHSQSADFDEGFMHTS